ncbi:enoyl-CoA hydratase-related protein [Actinomadura madurae]|uniref:enoyl-CoA hydratase-related protein n=1 Tax=Actinomadura madurae TaxID=1993 RepID=UPI0020D25E56|nr:enoyl-CoA hydratase-related protein [Actinomadura madurae]
MMFSQGRYPKPIIGAANATAVAGGWELLLNCDIVVTSDKAKFGLPEVKRGLFAAGGGTTLPGRIPLGIALELGLTGDLIDAARAYELGLVNRVVPAEDVLDTALDVAKRIGENGPLGVLATKKLMRVAFTDSVAAPRARRRRASVRKCSRARTRSKALALSRRSANRGGRAGDPALPDHTVSRNRPT